MQGQAELWDINERNFWLWRARCSGQGWLPQLNLTLHQSLRLHRPLLARWQYA